MGSVKRGRVGLLIPSMVVAGRRRGCSWCGRCVPARDRVHERTWMHRPFWGAGPHLLATCTGAASPLQGGGVADILD